MAQDWGYVSPGCTKRKAPGNVINMLKLDGCTCGLAKSVPEHACVVNSRVDQCFR